jgi:RNA polymerase sigma-B factor
MLIKEKNGLRIDETINTKKSDKNREWVKKPTIAQRNRWVEENLGLARRCAHRWAANSHMAYEDLEQVAVIALIGATERFDKSKGYKFSTFAMPIINFRIINFLRDKGHIIKIPRFYYDLVQKSKRTEKILTNKLGRKPTDKEIATAMRVSIEELIVARSAMANCKKPSSEENLKYKEKEGIRLKAEVGLTANCTRLSALQRRTIEVYFSYSILKAANILGVSQGELLRSVREAVNLVELSAAI